MESTEGNPKRVKMADEKDDLSGLREQISELMLYSDLEEEKMKNLKELSEIYISKLSEEMFQTDPVVNKIMKKLGMYSEKANKGFAMNPSKKTLTPCISLSLAGLPYCSPELETLKELLGTRTIYAELEISDLETKQHWSKGAPHFFKTVRMLIENAEKLHLKLTDRNLDPRYMTTADISENIFSQGSALSKCKSLRFTLARPIDFSVFAKFPSLEKFVLRTVDDGGRPCDFPNFFAPLMGIRNVEIKQNPDFLNIKHLDTIGVPKDSLMTLMNANLRLQHLAISLTCNVLEVSLKQCLNEYINSLISLKVLRGKTILFLPFLHMPLSTSFNSLNELELWGNVVTNINFLSNSRHLQKLRVDFQCFDCPYYSGEVSDGTNVFQGDIVENSLANGMRPVDWPLNVQVFITDSKLSSKSMGTLAIYLPNLKELEAPLPDNKLLYIVCDRFTKLEKLRLRFGSQIDDNGIDGSGKWPSFRGIRKLKFLQNFELEVECGQGKLTDRSAKLCFLSMESLRVLKLGFTGDLLTKEMEGRLREKINQVELYRSCSKTTPGGKVQRCCQWADFKRDWKID